MKMMAIEKECECIGCSGLLDSRMLGFVINGRGPYCSRECVCENAGGETIEKSVLSQAIAESAKDIVVAISDTTDDVTRAMIERILWENMQQVNMDLDFYEREATK
jgi:hypothetical protein